MAKEKTKTPITPDMLLGDVVARYPKSAEIMMSYGLHCVGCHVSPYESIFQGALGHGMDEETIAAMMMDLNAMAGEEEDLSKSGLPVTLTAAAAAKLREVLDGERKPPGTALRILAVRSGEGYSYSMEFDDKEKDGDKSFESSGMKLVISAEDEEALKGTLIDFRQSAGFVMRNPNQKK